MEKQHNPFTQFQTIQFNIQNIQFESRYCLSGVPQGTITSPTLFLVGKNSKLSHINKRVKSTLLADDFVIFLRRYDSSPGKAALQQIIYNLSSRSQKHGLTNEN